jgi:hypothetical protein
VLAALPPEWTVFHDVHWPGRSKANIDHVVIGPAGVFVIDSKNWSGSITALEGVLRRNGYSRDVAVGGARAAAEAVAGLVPSLSRGAFVPVLCFAVGAFAATDSSSSSPYRFGAVGLVGGLRSRVLDRGDRYAPEPVGAASDVRRSRVLLGDQSDSWHQEMKQRSWLKVLQIPAQLIPSRLRCRSCRRSEPRRFEVLSPF